MGGRIADLDPDLRSLCLLAQRKAPEVKKAAEVAIVKLRSFDEENGSDADLGVFLKPISLSFSSMIPQLVSVALAAVQKLLATNRSSPVILTTIVRQLSMLTEIKDEGVQLRILQALALVHATTSVKEPSSDAEDPLVLAIRLCFQMLFFESNLIRNTAEATLRRIVSVFFERIGNAQESLGLQSAINLFKDFCKIVAGEQPTWLSVHETIGEALAADIIELLLEQNYDLVRKEEKFIEIIKVKLCPGISRLLRIGCSFALTLRLVRLMIQLVEHFQLSLIRETEMFMSMFIKMLEPEFPLWQRVIALEAVKIFSENEMLLFFFFKEYDENPGKPNKIFGSIAHSLGRFVHQSSIDISLCSSLIWNFQSHRSRGLDLLQETSPPLYDEAYCVAIAVQSVVNIVNCISSLTGSSLKSSILGQVSSGLLSPRTHVPDPPNYEIIRKMIHVTWAPVLTTLSSIIHKSTEVAQTQHLLLVIQSMTNACGVLMLSKPRNEYIKEVCILSLPSAYRVSVVSIENRNLSLQIEASEESSKCQLTIKNAQAMKALFNIAHCLGTVLGSSWLMVLEILEHLDRIIETNRSFQRGTRVPVIEMSVSNKEKQDALATQEDMLLLDAALSQLFESSISFDEVALSHLLYALGTLSLSSLASAATDELESASANSITQQMQSMETIPVPVQMFSLIKFVKTLEVNVFRITQVWDFAVGHLNCVINHKVPSIRAYGVFCLGKLTKLALAQSLENVKTLSIPEDPLLNINIEMERENAAFSVNKPDKACGREEYEGFILGPFEELYRSKYEDSKRNIILAVHDTVQSCGQVLSFGWVRIISLLKDVCTIESLQDTVSAGFKTLQLITVDFIECIPLKYFKPLIDVVLEYGNQRLAPNISLTSIGLLWHISDYITQSRRALTYSSDSSPHSSNQLQSPEEADDLQYFLFEALMQLSLDSRSEVRNSAIQTLHSTIAAYGELMNVLKWDQCITGVVFPLAKEVCSAEAAHKDSFVASAVELGKDKQTGEAIPMLMHHSRDTAEKQWNESRVHVLQGLSRIFRQFFDVMESLPNFPSHWSEYLSILEFSIINPWHEVSICAIQCLKESLQAVPVVKALAKKRDLVYVALQVYKNVVEAALSKQSNVDFTAYPILIESVSELLQGNQDVENSPLFTTEDMQMFLTLADTLSSVDPESLSIKSNMARETSLQRATLQLIDRLSFLSGPSHIWATILLQVIKYVRQALPESAHYWEDLIKNRKSQEMNAKVQTHSERTRAVSISSNSASFAFAQKAIPTLTILFCERLSLELRGTLSLFSSVLSSLLDVCTCSSISKVSPLSKVAFSAAIQVLEAGLDALNESSSMVDSANIDEFWFALRESFSMYLSTSNSVHVFDEVDDNSRVASAEIEELDCRLVNTVCHIVLPKSNTMSSSVRSEWIEMLSKYWRLALLDSGRFANMSTIQCSISGLFFLCSQTQGLTGAHVDTLKMTIGTQVAPVIIDLSTKIFRKYLEDERRSGQRPVALDHRSHVVHILKNILELRCSPVLQFGANPNSHATRTGECNLQLALFPLFSGLIVAREEIIKDYLRQIFLLIAEELGF